MSMGLSDVAQTMSPIRDSQKARVQSQNTVTEEVIDKNKQLMNKTSQVMGSSFEVSNQGLRSRGGKVDIQV